MSKKQEQVETIRLILGDQLNSTHSWLENVDDSVLYVMMEVRQETDYVEHHIQKIIGIFAAMRAFITALQKEGHRVRYIQLNDESNTQSIPENLDKIISETKSVKFEYQSPDEYRLREQIRSWAVDLELKVTEVSSEHFMAEPNEFYALFKGKKTYLMETFYRSMRKKYDILMEGDEPEGGKWNYDHNNRKKLPRDHAPNAPRLFKTDVSEIKKMIDDAGVSYIGNVDEKNYLWPINREQSLALLDHFVIACLPLFGTFQDAMTDQYWSLYHSRLSFSINTKMLSPIEVIQAVENVWDSSGEELEINQVEGFIRQILGWREYMRCIYWLKMPEYAEMNVLNHKRKLPSFFWNGKTKMNCVSHAVKQSLDYAYAHHIQRLMVTGNFGLLAGIHPDEMDQWYLGIYIDAFEWVEMPNTRGMSQYADGGIVGTKPYVSSANYMKKMGTYCDGCSYDHKDKVGGENACPFNVLYWDFYDRHTDKLERNPRIGMAYRTWNKMGAEKKAKILERAASYLESINEL